MIGSLEYILTSGILLSVPLLLCSLGELINQRTGILNLGIEGIMLIGAFVGYVGAFYFGSLGGFVFGAIIGGVMGLLMGVVSIKLRASQPLAGFGIYFLGWGLSTYFFRLFIGGKPFAPEISTLASLKIPFLNDVPVIGKILFTQNLVVYLSIIFAIICGIILFHSKYGLRIISVGEKPEVADSLGINVYHTRYLSVIFGGVMAGLAGAYLPLTAGVFAENMTAGRGWICIAIVAFSQWNPYKVIFGALLFSTVDALQLHLQAIGISIPYQFLLMLPYILTILALFIMARRGISPPAALTVPYARK